MLSTTALLFSLLTVTSLAGEIQEIDDTTTDFSNPDSVSLANGYSLAYLPLRNVAKDPAASRFKLIGGVAMDKPCCVSSGPRRVDCFVRTRGSNVLHWYKQDGRYHQEWQNLGGIIVSNVECVSRGTAMIDILVVGQNLALWVNSYQQSSGKWSGWRSKGGRIMEAPSCVARTANTLDCMARDAYNAGAYVSCTGGRWTRWENKKGTLAWPVKTSHRSSSITDFWHVGANSNLYFIALNSGRWGPSRNLGGPLRGTPEVVSMNDRRIDILAVGTKNQLMHLVWNGSWQKWVNLGGTLTDTPSCVIVQKSIQCFAVSSDSYLYRRSYNGKKWSEWFVSYGIFMEGPSCALSGTKEVSCYMRGFDRTIVEMVYKF